MVKIVFYFSELCKLHCLFTQIFGKLCIFVILGGINYVLRTEYYCDCLLISSLGLPTFEQNQKIKLKNCTFNEWCQNNNKVMSKYK